MSNAQVYEYPTIYFEGVRLPKYAATIDGATTNDVFVSEGEEDWAVWWWRFVICVGVTCSEDSSTILKHAATLKNRIGERRIELCRWISKRLYGDTEEILSDWLRTIDIVSQLASTREQCTWYGVAQGESKPK